MEWIVPPKMGGPASRRRDDDGLQLAVRVELGQDALLVAAARVEADAEPSRDRVRVEALAHQVEDVLFTRREVAWAVAVCARSRRNAAHPAQDGGQRRSVDEHLAVAHGADGGEDGPDRALLREEPARTCRGRAAHDVNVGISGHHHDPGGRVAGTDTRDRVDAVAIGQVDVQEYDIGGRLLDRREALANGGGRADTGEVRVATDRDRQGLRERAVIVDQEDACHCRGGRSVVEHRHRPSMSIRSRATLPQPWPMSLPSHPPGPRSQPPASGRIQESLLL
jgi:hypothetical protein